MRYFAILFLLVGCSYDYGSLSGFEMNADSGVFSDSAVEDSGTVVEDSGLDAGPDSGAPGEDSGTDSGTPDSGVLADAGPSTDSGFSCSDFDYSGTYWRNRQIFNCVETSSRKGYLTRLADPCLYEVTPYGDAVEGVVTLDPNMGVLTGMLQDESRKTQDCTFTYDPGPPVHAGSGREGIFTAVCVDEEGTSCEFRMDREL